MKKKQVWNRITSTLLALLLSIAFILPASASALTAKAQSPEELLTTMTTEEKVAQMLMPAFSYYTDEDGEIHGMAELTADAARVIGDYGFAGIALRETNTSDTEAAMKLLEDMQRANAGHKTRLLLAADQEGGLVTRLGHGTQTPGNMALGAANDTALTAEAAQVACIYTAAIADV